MTSCLNDYEKKLVGEYEVKDCEVVNDDSKNENVPKLLLKNDKKFLIIDGKNKLEGNWEAGDNGDLTYIYLFKKGTNVKIAEGRVPSDGVIDWFHCYSNQVLSKCKTIFFTKSEKTK